MKFKKIVTMKVISKIKKGQEGEKTPTIDQQKKYSQTIYD